MPKALVVQAARLGDLLQTKRLILSLKREHELHMAVDKSLAGLAGMLYPYAEIHKLCFHGAPDAEKMEANRLAFGRLRELGFEKIYNCNFSGLTDAFCRLFPSERVIGYRPAHDSPGGLDFSPWTRLVFRLGGKRRLSPLNLADYWGWLAPDPVSPAEVNPGAAPKGGGLGIAVAGREARRSLPAEVLAPMIDVLFRIMGGPAITLFGGAAESASARKILGMISGTARQKARDLTGKTGYEDLAAEVAGLDLLVTPDTGIMHLGAYYGTPVMAFFLSSAWPHETGPYGEGHLIWQSAPVCAPCLESSACGRNVTCLNLYRDPAFLRSLAGLLLENDKILADLSPGLSCWETALDEMGTLLRLKAGVDNEGAMRAAMRAVIAGWLDIEGFGARLDGIEPETCAELISYLDPPKEWMLPRERYGR